MSLLAEEQIRARLGSLPGWRIEGSTLTADFQLGSFAHAVLFIGAVGQLAEAAGHHPDLLLHGYKQVRVMLTTHSANGLTGRDFELAAQIQALPQKQLKA